MIPGQYYSTIYLLLVFVITIFVIFRYSVFSPSRLSKNNKKTLDASFIVAFIVSLFIGFRDPFSIVFGDSYLYSQIYDASLGNSFVWDWSKDNFIYDNLLLLMSSINLPISFFYTTIAIIYFIGIWVSCSLLFPNDTMASYVVYLAGFSTYAYGVNGIKAGAAAALFLVAIALSLRGKPLWTLILLFFSLGFHHSMLMPIVAFVICFFYKNPRFYVVIWFVSLIIAVFHITVFQNLFIFLGSDIDNRIVDYLGKENGGYYRSDIFGGFRIDFILYSVVPLLIGWESVFRRKIRSNRYLFILNLYTLINAIWMLCMYASFTNRIAYLSWLLYPIVLIYPFLKEKWGQSQYRVFAWVAFGNLLFALFMTYIY